MILKRKLRYILVEASKPFDAANRTVAAGLERALMGFMGEHDYADSNFRVATSCSDRVFVASVNRGSERDVALALAFVKHLDSSPIGLYTIRISGTMRKLLSEYKKLYA